ncbi:MAG: DUF692 domain-containing protein [Chromatiales bacterium]|nr:DUF692 domain-containing protein [Chromatiales bacterium]
MGENRTHITGAGLGLRRPMMGSLAEANEPPVDFLEVAPENWMGVGGALGRQFRAFSERYPMVLHGLSLNIGGPAPLDETFLYRLKGFIREHHVPLYSEHLSYCGDEGHLYDLMPIPFTEEAVHYVAARIQQVQDILEQRIAIENVSYYAAPGQEMAEIDFINAVITEADCELLLDVNNIYVNSINHGYNADQFLRALPGERIAYIHVAGHYVEEEDFLIDTHGAPINDPVWQLLETAYQQFGVQPTLLERDFNLPPLDELLDEVTIIRYYQNMWSEHHAAHA